MNVHKQQFKNFRERDITSDYDFLLTILNGFTVGTEEYHPKCYCSIILRVEVTNHKYWLI